MRRAPDPEPAVRTARPPGSSIPRTARSAPSPGGRGRSGPPASSGPRRPREQTTLTMPVSSSRFKKTAPWALSGCWRWVTTPPTVIRSPAGRPHQGGGGEHAAPVQPAPGQLHGGHLGGHSERPQGVGHLLPIGGGGEGRWVGSGDHTGEAVGRGLGRGPRPPHPGPAGDRADPVPGGPAGQAVEGPGGGQRLQLGPGHPGPAHQVLHGGPRASLLDPGRRLLAHPPHRGAAGAASAGPGLCSPPAFSPSSPPLSGRPLPLSGRPVRARPRLHPG